MPARAPHDPDTLLARLETSGLRGRGGGWFPAVRKWRAVRREGGEPVVVANGAEGEPGSIKDRFVLRTRAADVVAGLRNAAEALGATEAIVYLNGAFAAETQSLQRVLAADAASPAIRVHRGDVSYVVGEETALLESLEGRRAWPRPKPPLPCVAGLQGRPTLVQNVETLARVPAALADPEGYAARETTLVSLWGHVRRPGVYEVPLGTPLSRVIEEHGGGAPEGISMVFPGGPSTPPLSAAQLDVRLAPDALREAGSALGTAALLVVRESACPLCVGTSLAAFFEREACGQCPPCVQGTATLARVVGSLESGAARGRDVGYLREAAGFMAMHGYCAHPRAAAAALTRLVGAFDADVASHLAGTGCAKGAARCRPFDEGSPERVAIESALHRQSAAGS